MAGFMGDSSEGTFRKATGSVFPDCFIIGVSVQSSEGSQFSWKVGTAIIWVEVAISTKMQLYVFFFTPRAFGWYLNVPLKVKCATLIVYSRDFFTEMGGWTQSSEA